MKVYPFIAAEKAAAGNVVRACQLLSVSRSAYYTWTAPKPSVHQQRDEELSELIQRAHQESRGTYGAPRVQQRLQRQGVQTRKKRVARLMASRGLA